MSRRNQLTTFIIISILSLGITLDFGCKKDKNDRVTVEKEYPIGFIEPSNSADPYIFTCVEEKAMLILQKNQTTGNMKSAIFYVDG